MHEVWNACVFDRLPMTFVGQMLVLLPVYQLAWQET